MLILDSHLDLAWNAVEWKRDLTLPIEEIRTAEISLCGPGRGKNTVSFPELAVAEVGVCIATILSRQVVDANPPFLPFDSPEESREASLRQVQYYESMTGQGLMFPIRTAPDLEKHSIRIQELSCYSPLGFVLSMEGSDPILEVSCLEDWWNLGLRILGPAHWGQNRYGSGTGTPGGLTPDGIALLREMERLGMILDITHLTDEAMDQAFQAFAGPILASHHNCRSLVPGERQLSDRQILALIERGAVIGIAFDAWMLKPGWVRGSSEPQEVLLETAVDHIDHICQLAGNSRHVGIGSDLDGGFGTEQSPSDLNTIADLQKLKGLLEARGYSTEDVERIMHRNWIDFLVHHLPKV